MTEEPQITMSRPELLHLLRVAHDEIVVLRRKVAELEPRARAYDNIDRIVGMIPYPSQGYGEDVAWRIKTVVERIEAERDAERQSEKDQ